MEVLLEKRWFHDKKGVEEVMQTAQDFGLKKRAKTWKCWRDGGAAGRGGEAWGHH